jgi:DNA-binding transcriptional regulator GbsR (MarR family)
MTKRRPLTVIDISNVLGMSETNAARIIERLKAAGAVKEKHYGTKDYYIFSGKKGGTEDHENRRMPDI